MLITCPTCAAVYRVDDAAIGPTGRNVQCDACGAQWRQEPAPRPVAEAPSAAQWADEEPEDDLEEEEAEAAEFAGERPKTPGLEEAAELLQEMREESARSASIDIFSDEAAAAGRIEDAPAKPKEKPPAGREPISERELRATIASANRASPNAEKPRGGGFRIGFILALMVVGALAFAYLAKGPLAAQFPAAAGALDGYANVVDMIRGGVEGVAAEVMKDDAPAQ